MEDKISKGENYERKHRKIGWQSRDCHRWKQWHRRCETTRAIELGLQKEANLEEIVRDYIDDYLEGER